jgi:beta-ureidopropionase / N-carbamoyl-L-amino-acid hydrolase
MAINDFRLWKRINDLAALTEPDRPWTRRSFSPLFLQGRDWLASEYRQAGLAVSIDPGGNLIGRTEGKTNGISPIVIGSHSDTVPDGGRFDGILGLAAGIEVAQTLSEKGIVLGHPLEVIDFLAEEPSEFGISCVGSRAIAGLLDDTMLNAKAPNGETLKEGIARMGGAPERLSSRLRALGDTAAYVELHIEQGPVLESLGIPIGVVTDIFGISRTKIVVEGQPDHAGTTPMDSRRDALVGAARIIETAYRKASDMAKARQHVVATVGRLSVTPNAINAVPGRAELILEVRSESDAILMQFAKELVEETRPFCEELRLIVDSVPLSHGFPTACAAVVQDAIEIASRRLGLRSRRMPSGAGHDAVFMKHMGPIGMIFVPSQGGRSHCPEEWTEPSDVAAGAHVLYETVLQLDQKLIR